MLKNKLIILIAIFSLMLSTDGFAQTSTQTINLKQGLNFISFAVAVTLTPDQLKQLNSSIDDIYMFSAAAGSFISSKDGVVLSLAAGKGYIIKCLSDCSINVSGEALASTIMVNLKAGYNLVGFSKASGYSTFSSIISLGSGKINGIYKYINPADNFIPVIRNSSGNIVKPKGTDPAISAGQSYFIYMSTDAVLSYSDSSITIQ